MNYLRVFLVWLGTISCFGQGLLIDTYRVYRDPVGDVWEAGTDLLGTPQKRKRALAGVVLLLAADPLLTSRWQQHVEPLQGPLRQLIPLPFYYQRTRLGPFLVNSDGLAFNWIVGGAIAGTVFNKPRVRETAMLCSKVAVENFVVNHLVLKTVFGRNRPLRPLNAYVRTPIPEQYVRDGYPYVSDPLDWFNSTRVSLYGTHEGTAMPSFHSSIYFSFAAVLDEALLPWYVAYPMAMFPVAYDLRDHNHWVSDLVVAGVIGTAIGKSAVRRYDRRKVLATAKRNPQVSTLWYPSSQGLGFRAIW